MSELLFEVTGDTFESLVIKSRLPVVVDFWAPWCGPCQTMGPVLATLALRFHDQVAFAKCNVDDHSAIANRYGIKPIPTLVLFDKGKPVDMITGVVTQNVLADCISKVLAGEGGARPFLTV
jgi:thioredoxin 1